MHEQYTPERPYDPEQAQELLDLVTSKIKESGEHYENADAVEGQLTQDIIPDALCKRFAIPNPEVKNIDYSYEIVRWNRMDIPRTHGEVGAVTFAQTMRLEDGQSDLIHVAYELMKDDADRVRIERRISWGHDEGTMYPGGMEAIAEAIQRVPRLFTEELSEDEDEADEEIDEYIDYFEEIADRSVEARRLHEESRQQESELGLSAVSFDELQQVIDLFKKLPLIDHEA